MLYLMVNLKIIMDTIKWHYWTVIALIITLVSWPIYLLIFNVAIYAYPNTTIRFALEGLYYDGRNNLKVQYLLQTLTIYSTIIFHFLKLSKVHKHGMFIFFIGDSFSRLAPPVAVAIVFLLSVLLKLVLNLLFPQLHTYLQAHPDATLEDMTAKFKMLRHAKPQQQNVELPDKPPTLVRRFTLRQLTASMAQDKKSSKTIGTPTMHPNPLITDVDESLQANNHQQIILQ